jgi:hypothetical protein
MTEIKSVEFTFSKQAKKLPEIIQIDEEFAYILGLWEAEKYSAAKIKENHLRLYILKPNQLIKRLSLFLISKRKLMVA